MLRWPQPAGAATPDAWITTKIKLALLTTEGVSGTAIKVDTVAGQVTLYGKVHSAEEKAKAETIARKVDGVQGVRNLLQVVAPQHEKAMQVSDDDLKQRVEQALQADPSLKSSNITVQSVNQGVVLLGGTAKTLSAHLRAVEDAAAVPGVRRVASEIQSPDTLADAEIWRAPTPPSSAGYGAWDTASDIWITSAVRMSLIADSNVPGLEIDLDSWDGVVTLFGIVSSQDAKGAAEADALKVSGVKRVVNELQVVPSAKQPAVNASDDELQRDGQEGSRRSWVQRRRLGGEERRRAADRDRPNRGAEPGGRSASALGSGRARGPGRSAPAGLTQRGSVPAYRDRTSSADVFGEP